MVTSFSVRVRNSLYFLLPPLILLALGIRGITAVPLWVDELYTWKAMSGGLGETLGEGQYLPYYSFEWLATGGGQCLTETCMRMPSLGAMALASSVLAFTAGILFGRRAGLATGLLFVLTPSIQHWAQDARPYALATLLVSVTAMFFVLATKRESWPFWLGFCLFIVLSTAVLPMTLGQLLAYTVVALWSPRNREVIRRLAISFVAILPAIYFVVKPSLGIARSPAFHEADHFNPSLNDLFTALSWPTTGGFFTSVASGAFVGLLVALALLHRGGRTWYIAGGSSVVSLWLVSFIGPSFWLGRFAVPFLCFEVIGAGAIFATFSFRKTVAIIALAGIIVVPAYTENLLPWSRGYDWRSAAQLIDSEWSSGDSISVDPKLFPSAGWALEYYGRMGPYPANLSNPTRQWVINSWSPCDATRQWDLGLGHQIALCSQPR